MIQQFAGGKAVISGSDVFCPVSNPLAKRQMHSTD